jgi:DNA-binding GntR family transcriptional regulator
MRVLEEPRRRSGRRGSCGLAGAIPSLDTESEMQWRSRIRLVDEVAGVLRDRIYAGDLAPGMPLRQEQLASELDVSRTPLREALRILEREGLVTVEPNRGVRVISADLPALLAAYEVREVLDGLAARLATKNRSPDLVQRLREIVHRQQKALTPWQAVRYTEENVAFHARVIEAGGNEFLTAQLPLVPLTAQVFTPVERADPSRAELAVGEHIGIIEAIEQGLDEKAERRARAHIRRTREALAAEPASAAEAGTRSAAFDVK